MIKITVFILLAICIYSNAFASLVPDNEADCMKSGGNWIQLGLPYPDKSKVCDLPAKDYGKICTDTGQCQGACFAPDNSKIGSATEGMCSQYILNFGNLLLVEDGKVIKLNAE